MIIPLCYQCEIDKAKTNVLPAIFQPASLGGAWSKGVLPELSGGS